MTIDERHFITMDVFTDQRFGGNPLAIFPQADGLDETTMQRIAAEMNLSETVFLHSGPDSAVSSLRIFTPKSELPFAGHPTVGAAIYLAEEAGLREGDTLTMQTIAGSVAAHIRQHGAGLTLAEITAPQVPQTRPAASIEQCAAAISLQPSQIPHAPRICDAGNPFTVIPVDHRETLSRAKLDQAAWAAGPGATDAAKLFIVTMEDWQRGNTIHARMFAPSIGIAEDPTTGSAAVALAAMLNEVQSLADGPHHWRIHQGDDMGRPSVMALRAEVRGGKVASAHVGGTAVRVIKGTLRTALSV